MINVSYYDDSNNVAAWWLCLTIAVLAICAPIAITVLFFRHQDGPMLKDAYERMPLKKSIWEVKPITQGVQEMLANLKATQEEEKLRREKAAARRL